MIGLVSSRLARRRGAAGLVALAIAGAIVVVGSLFGVGVVTADVATRQALADLPPRERAVSVNRHADGQFDDAGADAAVRTAFDHLGDMAGPVLDAISFQPAIGYVQYFALDDVGARVVLSEGRLPAPCDGTTTCEGIRVSSFEVEGQGSLGSTSQLGDLAVTVVGIAEIAPGLPLDPSDALGIVVLVDGVRPLATSTAVEDVPRTRFWVAPIDPERAHSWRLPELRDAIDDVERALATEDASYVVNAPDEAFVAVEGRTATASGRLVFIASMIVAVLLAFAVFAAAIEREDVGLEYGRLRTSGARRGQLLLFVVAEAAVPAIAGAVVGWAAAVGLVGAIALAAGAAPLGVLGVSLLQPDALAVVAAIAILAAVAVGLGIHPGSGRLVQPRLIAVAVLPAVAVLAWDRLVSGSLDPTALAGQALGPGTVLFPGLVGLTLIFLSLVVIPRIFRALAGRGRRAPLPLRLSLVATAREPLRPAATTTLLAFGVGAAVFAMSHGQTLARPRMSEGRPATAERPMGIGGDAERQLPGTYIRSSWPSSRRWVWTTPLFGPGPP